MLRIDCKYYAGVPSLEKILIMKNIFRFVFPVIILLPVLSEAQGCSDAGFCTLHYREQTPVNSVQLPVHTIGFEAGYNIGEKSTRIINLSVEHGWHINQKIYWRNKITAAAIHGDFGNLVNVGDLYSTIGFSVGKQNPEKFSLLAGVKIPLTRSDDKMQAKSLPMVYQTSLGTYDLVAGGSVLLARWDIQFAAQLPLINQNHNSYLAVFSSNPGYLSTNSFRRKSDVLLRIDYPAHTGKWTFHPNLLGIYHLGNDSYVDQSGVRTAINGSDGFTLNANLQANCILKKQQSIQFSLATPLVVRENRPDGLTRSFVASVAYSFGW